MREEKVPFHRACALEHILDSLLYLMQNPVIKKLLKNRRKLSILGLRIHIMRRGWGEGGGRRNCAKAQPTKLCTEKILPGEPHVRSGCNSVFSQ